MGCVQPGFDSRHPDQQPNLGYSSGRIICIIERMKKAKVAINGFGRIGRQFYKVAYDNPQIEVVAVNDLASLPNLKYLLEYDTVYGHFYGKLNAKHLQEPDPAKLPWKNLDIDIVIESTGRFTSAEKAKAHLDAGAKRVVITAPAKDDETPLSTPNINEDALTKSKISSNASCTTNATTPVVAVLMGSVGIKAAVLNTVHGYTAEQSLVDGPTPPLHPDFRRGRAAAQNIVPTSSGSDVSVARAIPGMADKFAGLALRVPVPAGSILDLTFVAERDTSVEEINKIFTDASRQKEWQGILTVTDQPLVSSDILKNPHGAIVDLGLTRVVGGNLVKVMVWYDNEWGYACMLLKHVLSLIPFLE